MSSVGSISDTAESCDFNKVFVGEIITDIAPIDLIGFITFNQIKSCFIFLFQADSAYSVMTIDLLLGNPFLHLIDFLPKYIDHVFYKVIRI